jgi:hypothetical protein
MLTLISMTSLSIRSSRLLPRDRDEGKRSVELDLAQPSVKERNNYMWPNIQVHASKNTADMGRRICSTEEIETPLSSASSTEECTSPRVEVEALITHMKNGADSWAHSQNVQRFSWFPVSSVTTHRRPRTNTSKRSGAVEKMLALSHELRELLTSSPSSSGRPQRPRACASPGAQPRGTSSARGCRAR